MTLGYSRSGIFTGGIPGRKLFFPGNVLGMETIASSEKDRLTGAAATTTNGKRAFAKLRAAHCSSTHFPHSEAGWRRRRCFFPLRFSAANKSHFLAHTQPTPVRSSQSSESSAVAKLSRITEAEAEAVCGVIALRWVPLSSGGIVVRRVESRASLPKVGC